MFPSAAVFGCRIPSLHICHVQEPCCGRIALELKCVPCARLCGGLGPAYSHTSQNSVLPHGSTGSPVHMASMFEHCHVGGVLTCHTPAVSLCLLSAGPPCPMLGMPVTWLPCPMCLHWHPCSHACSDPALRCGSLDSSRCMQAKSQLCHVVALVFLFM